MNSRERFELTMNHREPDRVPYNAFIYQELADGLQAELPPDIDYRDYYGDDIRLIAVDYPEYKEIRFEDDYFPLPRRSALDRARDEIARTKDKGLVTCNAYIPGIFEHIKSFTTDEYALVHMMLEPDDMRVKIARVAEWLCRLYELYADAGYDICFNGDDLGTQKSTIMSMECYREFYKPHHAELIRRIKAVNPDTRVAFHCCGYIGTIVPEWIDIGVDIVHSVQPEANDLNSLKKLYGDRIVYWGALGLQSELFYLKLDEIAMEIRKCLSIMAPGGGYIAATSNYATGEIGIEKLKVLYRTLKEYGGYETIRNA